MADAPLVVLIVGHAGEEGQGCDAQLLQLSQHRVDVAGVAIDDLALMKQQSRHGAVSRRGFCPEGGAFRLRQHSAGAVKPLLRRRTGRRHRTVRAKAGAGDVQQHGGKVFLVRQPEILPDILVFRRREAGRRQQLRHLLRQGGLKVHRHPVRDPFPHAGEVRQGLSPAVEVDDGEVTALRRVQHGLDLLLVGTELPEGPAAALHEAGAGLSQPPQGPAHIPQPVLGGDEA